MAARRQACNGAMGNNSSDLGFLVCDANALFTHIVSPESLWIAGRYKAHLGRGATVMPNPSVGKQDKAMCLSFVASVKACAQKEDLLEGSRLHAHIRSSGLHKNILVGNTLISMYAKCGAFSEAQEVLKELPVRDVVSWSALISGYAQKRQGKEALNCYGWMLRDGLSPNAFTYACILKACGITQDVDKGKQIHEEIVSQGLLGRDVVLGNALVDMYAKSGALTRSQQVLDELSNRNAVSWSALIAGYAQEGQGKEALVCYERMLNDGISPDAFTYVCILKACGITGAVERGKQFHDEIVSQGLLAKNVVLGTALVDMYAKCGILKKAQLVLNELPIRNAASWNALISGYAKQGLGKEALDSFQTMRSEGLSPSAITYTSILKACGITQEIDRGKRMHVEVVSRGLLRKDVRLGAALVDMYAKCGLLSKAAHVMDELPVQNVVCWNALIAGYAEQGQVNDALNCYERMLCEGVSADVVTYDCILKACGIKGAVDKGKQLYDEIVNRDLLEKTAALGTALVDIYVKCGMLMKAPTSV